MYYETDAIIKITMCIINMFTVEPPDLVLGGILWEIDMGIYIILAVLLVVCVRVNVALDAWKKDKTLTSGSDPVVKFTGRCKGGEDEV